MSNPHSSFSLRSVLEKEKLNGSNFLEWYRNLRIVLKQEKKEYVLEKDLPEKPKSNLPHAERNAWEKHASDRVDVSCLMLATMNSDLQKQYDNVESPIEMITSLKGMFQEQARTERYQTVKTLIECKLPKDSPVSPHVIKMMGYIDNLAKLDCPISQELATDLILQSLPSSYDQFVMNYNLTKTLTELHGMLKSAEPNIKKDTPNVLMVQGGKKFKKQGKNKGNGKAIWVENPSKSGPSPKSKPGPSGKDKCHYCNGFGHWKRNYNKYLEDLKKKKTFETSSSGIYVIEVNVATSGSTSWVLDTGCGAHICVNMQGLSNSRALEKGQVDLRVGNGARVAALAVGTFHLSFPSGMVLELNNCYYVPAISRNIISISCLDLEGFHFSIKDKCCSFDRHDIFYGSGPLENGLYVLNQEVPVYNISTKIFKSNDSNPTFLWHCRLGHINEKHIQKLHSDGLLNSFDYESYEKCESCLLGKMTKAPFTGQSERASELLGLIHTDVCGPMSLSARRNYQYFITFTDDFSRYGYVYLMKHKSESFEKFKEFQNEVQNQLGKTIKVLRSDRGGEYLSQAFSDHLRECGIVSQLTPPGTPQWNGVSERRNRTLLDMVRSMMSHTDLPLSFWGYALETSAFTLNRCPSKSVEKTPYEMWTGKVPNLSFLKIWGCEAYVKRLIADKLGPKSDKCYFVGYPKETKGYYFYNPAESKVFVARNCVFLEREFLSKRNSGSKVQLEEVREPQKIVPPTQEEHQLDLRRVVEPIPVEPEVRRSERTRHEPDRFGVWVTDHHDIFIIENDEPMSYEEAMMGPDSDKWTKAAESEMESMSQNKVWTLVDLPDGVKAIECKWIFKKKIDMDGNIQIYKARLVAKGYKQIHGIDYDETYSPVAMFKSIRILLAIAAYHDYEIWHNS
ncbi:Retrovirus-related Pol polyprotein from transposon TNT 1-94 [Cardamine amara subsp. amara]|uniref:Retrovirus-related Pol polyprotein from transposon TNT 1-94 n=1 Tax=Cardamine amara subsp. amara TaxID=228776 RepID=A0ABD0ZJR2_CARAN